MKKRHKKKIQPINNFVSKHAQSCGAGAHGKTEKAERRSSKVDLIKTIQEE